MSSIDISIIVPAYNTKDKLPRLIDSISHEGDRPSYEIILVDDCSSDGTGELCDRLAASDGHIHVIHQPENGGSAHAKNTALAEAKGEYIFFADSDDELIWSGISDLFQKVREGNYDIVSGTYKRIEDGTEIEPLKDFPEGEICRPGKLYDDLKTKNIFGYATMKLYKKAFLDKTGVRFEKIPFMEDQLFNLMNFAASPSYYFCNSCNYIYYIHSDSVSHKSDMDVARNNRIILEKYYSFLEKNNSYDENADLFIPLALRLLCWTAFKNIPYEGAHYKIIKERMNTYVSCAAYRSIFKDKKLKKQLRSIPSRLQQIFFGICYDLTRGNHLGLLTFLFVAGSPIMKKYVADVVK